MNERSEVNQLPPQASERSERGSPSTLPMAAALAIVSAVAIAAVAIAALPSPAAAVILPGGGATPPPGIPPVPPPVPGAGQAPVTNLQVLATMAAALSQPFDWKAYGQACGWLLGIWVTGVGAGAVAGMFR